MYLRISLTEEPPALSHTKNGGEHIFNCTAVPQDEIVDYYETVIDPVVRALADKIRSDYEIDDEE